MEIVDSRGFMEALLDVEGNPDQRIEVNEPQGGHYVDESGGVWSLELQFIDAPERFVGQLPEDVFRHRLDAVGC